MSNKKLEAVEGVRKLARTMRGLLDFADEVERLGSIEQATAEVESRFSSTKQAEDEAQKRLASAEREVSSAIDSAKTILSDAKAKAAEIVQRTSIEAVAKIETAEKKAEASWRDAADKKADIEKLIVQANADLAKVKAELASRRADLAKIEKRLEEIRQKVA